MSDVKTPKTNSLEVKVTASEKDGVLQFEGSVALPSLAKTKLANKEGVTKFETLAALKGVARRVATRLQYEGVTYDEASVQRRVAAKKSATPTTPTPAAACPTSN